MTAKAQQRPAGQVDQAASSNDRWEFVRRNPLYRADYAEYAARYAELIAKHGIDGNGDPTSEFYDDPAGRVFEPARRPGESVDEWEARTADARPTTMPLGVWFAKKWGLAGDAPPDPRDAQPAGLRWANSGVRYIDGRFRDPNAAGAGSGPGAGAVLIITAAAVFGKLPAQSGWGDLEDDGVKRVMLKPTDIAPIYDTTRPLAPQLKAVEKFLKRLEWPGNIDKRMQRRKHPDYLRVLDMLEELGASSGDVSAKHLRAIGKALYGGEDYPDDDRLRDNKVRADVKAARQLRDEEYGPLPGFPPLRNLIRNS